MMRLSTRMATNNSNVNCSENSNMEKLKKSVDKAGYK